MMKIPLTVRATCGGRGGGHWAYIMRTPGRLKTGRGHTVFPQSDAAATNCFTLSAVRLQFEGGYNCQCAYTCDIITLHHRAYDLASVNVCAFEL